MEQIEQYLLQFATSYPKATAILATLYIVAVGMKLLQPVVAQVIALTPSKSDDAALEKAQASKVWKAVAYVLDLIVRIKVKA